MSKVDASVSPRPWRVDDQTVNGERFVMIYDANEGIVYEGDTASDAPLCALIVRAVNAHDELVAALREFVGERPRLATGIDGKTASTMTFTDPIDGERTFVLVVQSDIDHLREVRDRAETLLARLASSTDVPHDPREGGK